MTIVALLHVVSGRKHRTTLAALLHGSLRLDAGRHTSVVAIASLLYNVSVQDCHQLQVITI